MQMTDPFIQLALSKTFYGRVSFHIPTDKLEDYILLRYEQDAPQCELDILETAFSARVTEDDILMTEDDDRMSEDMINGASLEECLFDIYSRYLEHLRNPDGDPVNIFFLLLAPYNASGIHLKSLAKISGLLKDKYFRKSLVNCASADEVLTVISEEEKLKI